MVEDRHLSLSIRSACPPLVLATMGREKSQGGQEVCDVAVMPLSMDINKAVLVVT